MDVLLEREPVWAREFDDLRYEWFGELFGTFLLVLAGGGAPVVDAVSHGQIGRAAAVAAPTRAGRRTHCLPGRPGQPASRHQENPTVLVSRHNR